MQRLVLEIQLFPGDVAQGQSEKTIREPKALLSILDSLDEIQKKLPGSSWSEKTTTDCCRKGIFKI